MGKPKWSWEDTPVARISEGIRAGEPMPAADNTAAVAEPAPAPAPKRKPAPARPAKAAVAAEPADEPKAKKTEVGITIQLPKKYHRVLRDIRDETGVPVRDLALRAVIDFVDNYKFEE